ncbi:MAG: flagellar motor protein [Rhodospirillales bacterium 20-64-7]|nr:MAG: flagellar motor protein [Rhodospirillales bacterium 20-64-7]
MSGILGIIAAFAVVILGSLSDGDPLSALVSMTATIIVFGGTFAAILTQFGFGHVMTGLMGVKWLLKPPKNDMAGFIEKIASWSNLARSQGTLALEGELAAVTDPFLRKGLQLIIDNTGVEELHPILAAIAANMGREELIAGEVWEAAGGYTPTIGVMGAVLGLIHVMMRLDHPEELGEGVATAFVATIYGVGAANLIFLPLGTRFAALAETLERERNIIIQGFVLLAEGKPGILIRQNLQSLLAEHGKKPSKKPSEAEASGETAELPA